MNKFTEVGHTVFDFCQIFKSQFDSNSVDQICVGK